MKKIKIDGKEFEVEDVIAEHLATLTSKCDTLEGAVDALKTKKEDKKDEVNIDAAVTGKVKEIMDAAALASDFLPEDYSIIGKTPRDIMVDAIKQDDAKFDAKNKSDEYIKGRFDAMIGSVKLVDSGEEDKESKEDKKGARQDVEELKKKRLNMYGGGK
jgi:hypothetical protein